MVSALVGIPVLAGSAVFGAGLLGADTSVLTNLAAPLTDRIAGGHVDDTGRSQPGPASTGSAPGSAAAPAGPSATQPAPAAADPDTAATPERTTPAADVQVKAAPKPTSVAAPGPSLGETNVAPAGQAAGSRPVATDAGVENEVLRLVNAERRKADCKPLTMDGTLTKVARAHSKDMAQKGYFAHESRNGRTPFDRMSAAGYKYSWAAENIAAGQATPAAVMDSWMKSEGHRANILNCKLTELGVGFWRQPDSEYNVYWTQDFGTPR